MITITNKKQYPSEQYLNELITNIEFAARAPVEVVRAMAAELQKRREADSAEPVAYIFKHPAGKLFWALTDESNKEQADVIPVYAAPPVPTLPAVLERLRAIVADPRALPRRKEWVSGQQYSYVLLENVEAMVDEACRAAMLQSQGEGNPHATPTRLPGGFTIEDAKALHEDLVRSHISKVLSGEKMKKKDRDADLRWIHDVIVQAAWFVKASLEQNALSGTPPVTTDGWISCSERMPEETGDIIVVSDGIVMSGISYSRRDGFYIAALEYDDDEPIDGVTHWMPLPEPPKEVRQ
ncbi:TPA: DUF551 domain-containing protein [Escherichia coli]|nr:DUF551 domain-containing protein [Escherichia coli]HBH5294455.1 DUF551 domain-containing protein [Escherichia coli]